MRLWILIALLVAGAFSAMFIVPFVQITFAEYGAVTGGLTAASLVVTVLLFVGYRLRFRPRRSS